MGLFKGMKDMKNMVDAAPGMIDQATQMQAQAQQMAAAQQAAMANQTAANAGPATDTGTPSPAELEPIAGVSMQVYAQVSKGLAAVGYDQSKAVELAAQRGIDADSWQQAVDGWNQRMQQNAAVGREFHRHYTAS
jgi:hypothetical protein